MNMDQNSENSKSTVKLVLVRHGQSQWNLENRFTGWVDVELTDLGQAEAKRAADHIKKLGVKFDQAHTSVLKRAIHTLWIILKELDISALPESKSWQLNERHYGALQGLNKDETVAKYGADQVKIWRRSYDTPPPLDKDNKGESLKLCQERVLPYFQKTISPELKSGKNLLIVAHGNSLRSLIMEIEGLSGEKIMEVELETAVPIVYTLDTKTLKVIEKQILK
jgi:2,3-bisphosphoglycerate-dependent phosphoglycerate mutase